MMKPKTIEKYIEEARLKYGDKYDYSKSVYINNITPITIICPLHGEFIQAPISHLRLKVGCPSCALNIRVNKRRKTQEQFIIECINLYGDRYDYSKTIFTETKNKVIVTCKVHGDFESFASGLLSGHGCQRCHFDSMKLTLVEFIKKANNIHNNKYQYDKVNMDGVMRNVIIICPKHGEFEQSPARHLKGCGCPKCHYSKGENKVEQYLISRNIVYETQKRFKDCKLVRPLPFDFYLPNHNICIEYDGIQHHIPCDFRNNKCPKRAEEHFKQRQYKDSIKTQFCIDNNIRLIRIKYTHFKSIDRRLDELIFNS